MPEKLWLVNHCARLGLRTREDLEIDFGKSKYLLTIRDPRASIVSLLRAKNLPPTENRLEALCEQWERIIRSYGGLEKDSEVLVIRYEDLVANTIETMKKVAIFLDIPYTPILCQPTQLGIEVESNSSFGSFRGISTSPIDAWQSHITNFEKSFIEERLGMLMLRNNYLLDDS